PSDLVQVSLDRAHPSAHAVLVVPDAAAISGRIVDGSGAPIEGAEVAARPASLLVDDSSAPNVWSRLGQASDTSNADGRFRLAPLVPGARYLVFARPDPDRAERKLVERDVPAGTDDLLFVASEDALRRAALTVVVRAADGRPLQHVDVQLLIRLDDEVVDTEHPPVALEDGRLRLDGLAPGYEYTLSVRAYGLGSAVLPWFTAVPDGVARDLVLPLEGRLEATLRRAAGSAEGARLSATRRAGDFAAGPASGVADALGRITCEDLDPGTWDVRAALGRDEAHAVLEILPGETAFLTLDLAGP
ncbi:MAG: carboxypeptidase regulatory-like domain-containing protein, partial [Planctomycetes bacterium]|nr:carboxypeptidase regulatory-like domain-containing protein [Planctomycetota bacterium]